MYTGIVWLLETRSNPFERRLVSDQRNFLGVGIWHAVHVSTLSLLQAVRAFMWHVNIELVQHVKVTFKSRCQLCSKRRWSSLVSPSASA